MHQQCHVTPAAYTHKHTHSVSLCLGGQIPSGEAEGRSGEPLASLHLNHDIVIVTISTAGTRGAGRTGFPACVSPTPTPGPGRPGIPGTGWTGRPRHPGSPGLQGPRSLCRGCKPGAVFVTPFGPFSCVLRATWVPSTPGSRTPVSLSHLDALSAGCRLQARVGCAGKALGPEGRSRHAQEQNW